MSIRTWWKEVNRREYNHVWKVVAENTLFPFAAHYQVKVRYFATEKRARGWAWSFIGRYGRADIYYKLRRGRDYVNKRGIAIHDAPKPDPRGMYDDDMP